MRRALLVAIVFTVGAACRNDALVGDLPDAHVTDTRGVSAPDLDPAAPLVRAGGTGLDVARAIGLDAAGKILVAGSFAGTARFGELSLTATHSRENVVAKLEPSGRFLWAVALGGSELEKPQAIAVDTAGRIVVGASFAGSVALGGKTLQAEGPADLLVVKLDSDGKVIWAAPATRADPATDDGLGLAVGGDGAVSLTGSFAKQATFGASTIVSTGDEDIFVARLDASGAWVWAKAAGGAATDNGTAVAVNGAGDSFITGSFTAIAGFGSKALEIPPIAPPPLIDCFVAKLDTAGSFLWAKRLAFASDVHCRAIALGADGTATLTGAACLGGCRSFVARVDAKGDLLWSLKDGPVAAGPMMPEQSKVGLGVAVDAGGASTVAGRIVGSAYFGDTLLTARGASDAFVTRVDPAGKQLLGARALGTLGADAAYAVALDASGNAYLAGTSGTANILDEGDLAIWRVTP